MQCDAYGSPAPRITWFDKANRRLAWCSGGEEDECGVDEAYESQYVLLNKTLVIKNASYTANDGSYRCNAVNIFGKVNKSMVLNVRGEYNL